MKRRNLKACIDDLKKLSGLPPYDGPSNYVAGDGYFAMSIKRDYDSDILAEAEKEINKLRREWNAIRARFAS